MEYVRALGEKHAALKRRIHGTRIPLGPRGRAVMTCVYIGTPIVLGYVGMQAVGWWAEVRHEGDAAWVAERDQRRAAMARRVAAYKQQTKSSTATTTTTAAAGDK